MVECWAVARAAHRSSLRTILVLSAAAAVAAAVSCLSPPPYLPGADHAGPHAEFGLALHGMDPYLPAAAGQVTPPPPLLPEQGTYGNYTVHVSYDDAFRFDLPLECGAAPAGDNRQPNPYDVAVGPSGLIHVSDTGCQAIHVFHRNGSLSHRFQMNNVTVNGTSTAVRPLGIAVDTSGHIFAGIGQWVRLFPWQTTVRDVDALQVYHPNGSFDRLFPIPDMNRITRSVDVGPMGQVAITDLPRDDHETVRVYHPNASLAFVPETPVSRIPWLGEHVHTPTRWHIPVSLDYGPSGLLAVSEDTGPTYHDYYITVHNPDGTLAFNILNNRTIEFEKQRGVAFGPWGRIALVDLTNRAVHVYYMDPPEVGPLWRQILDNGIWPTPYWSTPDWTAYRNTRAMYVDPPPLLYPDASPAFILSNGTGGGGDGEFSPIRVEMEDSGLMLVVDERSGRVMVFEIDTATVSGVDTRLVGLGALGAPGTPPLSTGQTVVIDVNFTRPLSINTTGGTPYMMLGDGTASPPRYARLATPDGAADLLSFSYTVRQGDTLADMSYAGAGALALNGSFITGGSLGLPVLARLPEPEIFGISPLRAYSPNASGAYGEGSRIAVHVEYPEEVTVHPDPPGSEIGLELGVPAPGGGPNRAAAYASGNGSSTLVFVYTVGGGENAADLDYAGTEPMRGVLVLDGRGNVASLELPPPGRNGSLGHSSDLEIDTAAPRAIRVHSPDAPGAYGAGSRINVTVAFSEPVFLAGGANPRLELETGTTDQPAVFTSGNGTALLNFTYAVQAGDSTPDLNYTTENALTLLGGTGTIRDEAGNGAIMELPGPSTTSSLGGTSDIAVDTERPRVLRVGSEADNGVYRANQIIDIVVAFDEDIFAASGAGGGAPRLELAAGPDRRYAEYHSPGAAASELVFRYAVQLGDAASDLEYAGRRALEPNGGTIADAAGNPANMTLPPTGQSGSLGHTKDIRLDTSAPSVTGVDSPNSTGTYGPGSEIHIEVSFSTAVSVTGTPRLALGTGNSPAGAATYASGGGTATLTFNYTVRVGDLSDGLDYAGPDALDLGGGKITDAIDGRNASLALPGPRGPGSLSHSAGIAVDGVAARVKAVNSTTPDGAYSEGRKVLVAVNFDEPVLLSGPPPPSLELGLDGGARQAGYKSGNGSRALVFEYEVAGGDTAADLDYTGNGSLSGGGGVVDAVGNAANLTLPQPGQNGSLGGTSDIRIDTDDPTVSRVYSPDRPGPYGIGSRINVTVAFSEPVFLAGGANPRLELETGTIDQSAVFTSGNGTALLNFTYAVQAGDSTPDLNYTTENALALLGGTGAIRDEAGNGAILELPDPASALSLGGTSDIRIDTDDPTVLRVHSPDRPGPYGIGSRINVTVAFSEPVFLAGGADPRLELETGATDRNATFVSVHDSASLRFEYAVQAGDSTPDLNYTTENALALLGGTGAIRDEAGNDADLDLPDPASAQSLGQTSDIEVDTAGPRVIRVHSPDPPGPYREGSAIRIAVSFNEPVFLAGGADPRLELETGTIDQSATYDAGNGTALLNFTYAVQAGDSTPDLNYTGTGALALLGGTGAIRDEAGNGAILELPDPASALSLGQTSDIEVDTAGPRVIRVHSPDRPGPYGIGSRINVTVAFSEPVFLAGGADPRLELETGATDRNATFVSVHDSASLRFEYAVQAGDSTPDLNYTTENALALLGGTGAIRDEAGNGAILELPDPASAQSLGQTSDIEVDTAGPRVIRVHSPDRPGPYGIGSRINVTVAFSEPVFLAGGANPRLELETGATDRNATFVSVHDSASLRFEYAVQAGDSTPDLNYTRTGALTLLGGTGAIHDEAGNGAILALPDPASALSLGQTSDIEVDTAGPRVIRVHSPDPPGPYREGAAIRIVVSFDEPVFLAGGADPRLELDIGAAGRNVTTPSGSGTTSLEFVYTVLDDDNTADLNYTSAYALTLPTGTIRDEAGNDAIRTLPSPDSPESLGSTSGIILDTNVPGVTSVHSPDPPGPYREGAAIRITVSFDEPVFLAGGADPRLELETGTIDQSATYDAGNGTALLNFTYTVQAGDSTPDLNYTGTGALTLLGGIGTIRDAQGNDAALALPDPNSTQSLGGTSDIRIDTDDPTVLRVHSPDRPGPYGTGSRINVTVAFSEPVFLAGGANPRLELETGTIDQSAVYESGDGMPLLNFTYTVQANDNTPDLNYTRTGALTLLGDIGAIRDEAGNDADLDLPDPASAQSLGQTSDIEVDTAGPRVIRVHSPDPSGPYREGAAIRITVSFDEPVFLAGGANPRLELETGTIDQSATYESGDGTPLLNFTYTVQANDNTPDLNYTRTGALALLGNIGTIRDAQGNDAIRTLPDPASAQSLGGASDIRIDTVSPSISRVYSPDPPDAYGIGSRINVTVAFSEPVFLAGGANPRLELDMVATDRNATFVSVHDSANLRFEYTVRAGDNTPDLNYTRTGALTLLGDIGAIRDEAGNDADLDLPDPASAQSLGQTSDIEVDTAGPRVIRVHSPDPPGPYREGAAIRITVSFDEPVFLAGGADPRLELETGVNDQSAVYDSGDGTPLLNFTYTVQADDNTPDLNYTTAIALTLLGGAGTIRDAQGNDAILELPAPHVETSLGGTSDIIVDTDDPSVTRVYSPDPPDAYGIGSRINVTVAFSEPVFLAGGADPRLELDMVATDRNATFVSGDASANLRFEYTVRAGDNTPDLNYTTENALTLLGGAGTIRDEAGNDADLDLPGPASAQSLGQMSDIEVDTAGPRVIRVHSPDPPGPYRAASVINVTVAFSEPVFLAGGADPRLELETGVNDQSAVYDSGDGTPLLNFTYTVQANDNTPDLNYTTENALTLLGGAGTIRDAQGNGAIRTLPDPATAQSLGGTSDIRIDTDAPSISRVYSPDSTDAYGIGSRINVTVAFSEPVFLAGGADPRLELETGTTDRNATFVSVHDSTNLRFEYTVRAGDNTPDLNYTTENALTLLGGAGTIRDEAGNDADLDLPDPASAQSLGRMSDIEVDTAGPRAVRVYSLSSNDAYGEGRTIAVAVSFSEPVFLAGGANPRLELDMVATDRNATFVSVHDSTDLRFEYTVRAGDNTPDLNYTGTGALTLLGGAGTIRDAQGNDAIRTLPDPATAQSLGGTSDIRIDTVSPSISRVYSPDPPDAYGADSRISVAVVFDEVVYVTGTPLLLLETGPSDRNATYASGSGTAELTFMYHVRQTDRTPDLNYTAAGALSLGAGIHKYVRDKAGNDADLELPDPASAQSLGLTSDIEVDTQRPRILSVSSPDNDGAYREGTAINITAAFDDIVVLAGGARPEIDLNTGGRAVYSSGSGTPRLNFTYTVGPGDRTQDLGTSGSVMLLPGGGELLDDAGNRAYLSLPASPLSSTLAGSSDLEIDTRRPTALRVTSPDAGGVFGPTAEITVVVSFDEDVYVHGAPAPRIALDTGGTAGEAVFDSGSGTPYLNFTYTVGPGDSTGDLAYGASDALSLPGNSAIHDRAGNDARTALPDPSSPDSLGGSPDTDIEVDTRAPRAARAFPTDGADSHGAGSVVNVTVAFDEAVYLTGPSAPPPSLALVLDGGAARQAGYAHGSGTRELVFNYTVRDGDNAASLRYNGTNALSLPGGVMLRDEAGNDAVTALPDPSSPDSLGGSPPRAAIDTDAPRVLSVTSPAPGGGVRGAGPLLVSVHFDEPVSIPDPARTPSLALNLSGAAREARYAGGAGTAVLNFSYLVRTGDSAAPLEYAGTDALRGMAADAAGNPANMTLPPAGSPDSLGGSSGVGLDARQPAVVRVYSHGGDGAYGAGSTVEIAVEFDEDVHVDGAPRLYLDTGGAAPGRARYASGSAGDTLVFEYAVRPGDSAADLEYAGASALVPFGGRMYDEVGNAANRTLPEPRSLGSLSNSSDVRIDTLAPRIDAVSSTASNGTYRAGDAFNITIAFSEPVLVAGSPILSIDAGSAHRRAPYAGGNGTGMLSFLYEVRGCDATADLAYTGARALSANRGTIRDDLGNDANLTLPGPGSGASLSGSMDISLERTAPDSACGYRTQEVRDGDALAGQLGATGEGGAADGRFLNPAGVAVSSSGMVAVADLANARVQVFDASGRLALKIGPPGGAGAGGGRLGSPVDVAFGPSGDIYVADERNHTVAIYAPDGSFRARIGTVGEEGPAIGQLARPGGVDVDAASGMVAVADTWNQRVQVFRPDGTPALAFGSPGYADGEFIQPKGVAFGPSGMIAVADTGSHRVQVFEADGTHAFSFGSHGAAGRELDRPTDVDFDRWGRLAVADQLNHRVKVFYMDPPDAGPLWRSAVDDAGAGAGRLPMLFADGSPAYVLGGGERGAADGQFDHPVSVAFGPSGTVAVVDAENQRVRLFEIDAPTVAGAAVRLPGEGSLPAGSEVVYEVAFTEGLDVDTADGAPYMLLGGVGGGPAAPRRALLATPDGPAVDALEFSYAVRPGDTFADLAYASAGSLSMNGSFVTGGPLGLPALALLPAPGSVDTTPPELLRAYSPNASGAYGIGSRIAVHLDYSEPVAVVSPADSLPFLEMDVDGAAGRGAGSDSAASPASAASAASQPPAASAASQPPATAVAPYESGNNTRTLAFSYTVLHGDSAEDLEYAGTGALGGGRIVDMAGHEAHPDLPEPGSNRSLGASADISVDGVPARVAGVAPVSPNGTYAAGERIVLAVHFDEPVWIAGSPAAPPTLALDMNGTVRLAGYESGSGTRTLEFSYTVQAADRSAGLEYAGTAALAGAVADAAGNAAVRTLPEPGSPGSLGAASDIAVVGDAPPPPPSVVRVRSINASGTYGPGADLHIAVEFTRNVTVHGQPPHPRLLLNASDAAAAAYASGNGTASLVFAYAVAPGDLASSLGYAGRSALGALPGGSAVRGPGGAAADLSLPEPGSAASLSGSSGISVDGVRPSALRAYPASPAGEYGAGETILLAVEFTEPVAVSGWEAGMGPPLDLALSTGGLAGYESGGGTPDLLFSYEVLPGDFAERLDYAGTDALSLRAGARLADAYGNAADLSLPPPGSPGSLGVADAAIFVNATQAPLSPPAPPPAPPPATPPPVVVAPASAPREPPPLPAGGSGGSGGPGLPAASMSISFRSASWDCGSGTISIVVGIDRPAGAGPVPMPGADMPAPHVTVSSPSGTAAASVAAVQPAPASGHFGYEAQLPDGHNLLSLRAFPPDGRGADPASETVRTGGRCTGEVAFGGVAAAGEGDAGRPAPPAGKSGAPAVGPQNEPPSAAPRNDTAAPGPLSGPVALPGADSSGTWSAADAPEPPPQEAVAGEAGGPLSGPVALPSADSSGTGSAADAPEPPPQEAAPGALPGPLEGGDALAGRHPEPEPEPDPEPEPEPEPEPDALGDAAPAPPAPDPMQSAAPASPPAPPGGGCLIATAAYGTELAPQVQKLREVRDGTLLPSELGSAFMRPFSAAYYAISPSAADVLREYEAARRAVALLAAPAVHAAGIAGMAEPGSDAEVAAYGIVALAAIAGIYSAAPAAAASLLAASQARRRRARRRALEPGARHGWRATAPS